MAFFTKGVIFQIENDPITMKLWVYERDYYTCIQKKNKVFDSKEYIFLVESRRLEISVGNKIDLCIVV